MKKQRDVSGQREYNTISYFKKFAVLKISTIILRNQIRQGFDPLKVLHKENGRCHNQISSNKDTQSSPKSIRVEKQYLVQVSLEKIKLTNKFGRQSLQIMPKDLNFSNKIMKRSSLKEDVQFIKIQNEKNIKEFNSKIQSRQQSKKLKQINQIIELQTFGPKILADQLKKKRESPKGGKCNFFIFLPILILILVALILK